jgi:hypothetical protein
MADGLLNKASIILTPTGYKAGTLYNVAPIDEPYEDFDFARTSTATRINSSGLVSNVATGVPRISYDSNGENGHILLEPTSTNLVPYSENFEGGSWSNASIGTTPTLDSGYTAPDGSSTAYKISNANQDSFWYYPSVADSNYARTIWARAVSGTGTAQLLSHNSNTNNIFTLTETWQRFEVNSTTSSTGETGFYAVDFRGSGTLDEVLVWGAQSENLSYATSYIPTLTGSTETRATETATGAGSADLINSTEGVLYTEIAMLSEDDKDADNQIAISDGTVDNRIMIFIDGSGDVKVQLKDDTEVTKTANLTALDQSQSGVDTASFNKIAIQYKSGENKLFVNGSEITNSAFNNFVFNYSATPLNVFGFDNGANSSNYFRGKCKALAVFKEALSDSELTQLTT